MKRDMDLARKLLLAIEEEEMQNGQFVLPAEGYTEAQVMYRLGLLYQANLITAIHIESLYGDQYVPEGLTREGHDFVEAARNDTSWNKVKTAVAAKSGAMTFEVVKGLLTGYAKAHMGLP